MRIPISTSLDPRTGVAEFGHKIFKNGPDLRFMVIILCNTNETYKNQRLSYSAMWGKTIFINFEYFTLRYGEHFSAPATVVDIDVYYNSATQIIVLSLIQIHFATYAKLSLDFLIRQIEIRPSYWPKAAGRSTARIGLRKLLCPSLLAEGFIRELFRCGILK
jgi:hypothetical protein